MSTRHEPNEWPCGEVGDLGVFYFDATGSSLMMEPVESENEARKKFREISGRRDIYTRQLTRGESASRTSSVVCWARCSGGKKWDEMGATEGYQEEAKGWG